MREIKFKAKRIDNDNWVYGDVIHDIAEHNMPRICIDREYSTGTTFVANAPRVNYKTIGQYTGLTDKNGKEIYEGDIVCTRFPKGCEHEGEICHIGDVRYENGCFGAVWTIYAKSGWHSLRRFDDDIINDIEVLGNIWDNNELLKWKSEK